MGSDVFLSMLAAPRERLLRLKLLIISITINLVDKFSSLTTQLRNISDLSFSTERCRFFVGREKYIILNSKLINILHDKGI